MKLKHEIYICVVGPSGPNRGTVDHVLYKIEYIEWDSEIKFESTTKIKLKFGPKINRNLTWE